jgi:2-iminobutanoate/2-iminopropanoate deaminase
VAGLRHHRRSSFTADHAMQVEVSTPAQLMKPIGPYNHIAKTGDFIALSGTAGIDPATGDFAGPDTYAQARQILRSLRAMLDSVGAGFEQVLHVNVFMLRMDDFEEMNRAYREAFGAHLPARTVIGVAALPKRGALLTMDLTAVAR